MNETNRLDFDRLGVTSGTLVLGMAIARFLESPVRPIGSRVLGSALGINISLESIALVVLVGMAITASESIIRSHPLARAGEVERSFIYWIIPAGLVLGLASWQSEIGDMRGWALSIGLGAILIPLSLALEYAAVDPDHRGNSLFAWGGLALAHVAALLLFSRVFDLRWRSLLSGTIILSTSTALSWRVFWALKDDRSSVFPYAAGVGLMMGMMAWSLNYWPLTTVQGGFILFILFYAIVGLIGQFLGGRSGRQVIVEYVGLSLIFALVVLFAI